MFYIIAYDTPSDKRRRKMAKAILGFARRVQKSVYEANLDRNEYIKMLENIERVIDAKDDNVRIYGVPKDEVSNIAVYGSIPLVNNLDYEYS